MSYKNNKLGAFIVPTGVGASIGGFAGDAGSYVRQFASKSLVIVNPNVVNAGCFSAITENMLYTEGYSLDEFLKGNINLLPKKNNRIGIIYDKAIPQDVLNVHINTQNAVKTVYGIDIHSYTITDENVGVKFYLNEDGISVGDVENIETLGLSCEKLLNDGCEAIAIVCLFDEAEDDNPEYLNGKGVDPVGGVEAIISHYISKHYKIPTAHSPAFVDYSISSKLVNAKACAEYITPTFLPCILIGLSNAPHFTENLTSGISVRNLDYIVMPYNCMGGLPVIEGIKHNIPIYAVKENSTVLDVTKDKLLLQNKNIIEVETYKDLLELL